VARSTLADANESCDWRIFADFAHRLIATARGLYVRDPLGVDMDESLYALDSTTIDLCLALFPWARFRRRKAALKLHTLLDLRGNIPTFIRVTDGKVHDVNMLDEIMPEAGAFYVMDPGYIDFQRLFVLTLSSAFFVVRTKSNVLLQRRYSHAVDKSTGVRSDQTVLLSSYESASVYPDTLRRVSYVDAETGKRLKFLTNNFALPALTIAQIYKQRWQVELFMHTRAKRGESRNLRPGFSGVSALATGSVHRGDNIVVSCPVIHNRVAICEASHTGSNSHIRPAGCNTPIHVIACNTYLLHGRRWMPIEGDAVMGGSAGNGTDHHYNQAEQHYS
jgi:hypothetical protein